ncbi:hypothetical protein RLEG12_29375 [Rhizobium leguminosarum bv. trifolii CB782]|nr:hypothetical protein RLEG12_29375 [Rhizobium leguminosarum bv. trifolii CB782]
MVHIYVMGASGSGTTSLGLALAEKLHPAIAAGAVRWRR